jgi:uncharacterized protein involved in exopolysaccharide biosynthesis
MDSDAKLPTRHVAAPFPTVMQPEDDAISVLTIINTMMRHVWLIITCGLIALAIVTYNGMRAEPEYTSKATFLPSGNQSSMSGVSGLAAQLGLIRPSGYGTAYYVYIAKSPVLLRDVVQKKVTFKDKDSVTRTQSLIEFYHLEKADPYVAATVAAGMLRENVKAVASVSTNIVDLSVTARYPQMARQLADTIVAAIIEFNRRSRAKLLDDEQMFVATERDRAERRLDSIDREMTEALFRNRMVDPGNNPKIDAERDRIQQHRAIQRDVYVSLATAGIQSGIDARRSAPSVTVVEPAELPLGPDSSAGINQPIVAFVAGLVAGCIIAFILSYFARKRREEADEAAEFARLKRRFVDDIKHPWRPLQRIAQRLPGRRAA